MFSSDVQKYEIAAVCQEVTCVIQQQANKVPIYGESQKTITSVVFNFQYIHKKKKRMVYLDPLGIGAQCEETFRAAR